MEKLDAISVVCVCDNHYAVLLAALIKSIEINHVANEALDFYVVEDGITIKNKKRIENSILVGKTKIHWLPMAKCLPKNFKLPVDKSSLPLNIYIRLFIPEFMPEIVKKIIYLDVDMIMLEDISKLWNMGLGDSIVAAVQDQFIQVVSRWGGISNYEELGIDAENKYFNAGLMIIDIKRWTNNDITNKVLNTISNYKKFAMFQDQYGLNAVLAREWFELDPLWNRFSDSQEERPFLIHFTGRKPIYKSYEFNENYRSKFYEYLNETGWVNFKPIGEASRYSKKISNLLEKMTNVLKF